MFCMAGILFSCRSDLDRVDKVSIAEDTPERTIINAEYFFSDSGITRNRLRAGKVEEYHLDPPRTELSEGVELLFYKAIGVEGSVLTSRNGSILDDGRVMIVRNEVIFRNDKGEELQTNTLTWAQDSDLVYTEDPVRIIREYDTIHGVGLEANEDFSRYTVKKITGKLYVEDDGALE